MSIIYFISGLGADWRMFRHLRLPSVLPYRHVQWLAPRTLDEPLQAYVHRLKAQIQDPHPILVGLSFGGIVATELAKVVPPRKLIIISSMATSSAFPWYYRLLGRLQLHRLVPLRLLQRLVPLAPWFFGAKAPSDKKLLREIILNVDERFLRWSFGQLVAWRQQKPFQGVIHIHGTHDKVLPFRYWPGIIPIRNGEHLAVLQQADEISTILSRILKEQAVYEQG